ncbi:MAG: hypothetical protein PVI86_12765 [Phycisphaerae bacterium]
MSAVGDVVGNSCFPAPCDPPQGVVDELDISSLLDKFTNAPGSPRKARSDVTNWNILEPLPDHKIDFIDIAYTVEAFRGEAPAPVGPPEEDPCPRGQLILEELTGGAYEPGSKGAGGHERVPEARDVEVTLTWTFAEEGIEGIVLINTGTGQELPKICATAPGVCPAECSLTDVFSVQETDVIAAVIIPCEDEAWIDFLSVEPIRDATSGLWRDYVGVGADCKRTLTCTLPTEKPTWAVSENPGGGDIDPDTGTGTQFEVEGIAPSADLKDVELEYRAEDLDGDIAESYWNLTVVETDLDAMKIAHNAPNGELSDEDEEIPGAFVPLNNDDDDYDVSNTPDKDQAGAIIGESDLLPLVLHQINPLVAGGMYTLDIPAHVRIWKAPDRTDAVNSMTEFDATADTTVYVEGVTQGAGDVKVNWKTGASTEEGCDKVQVTVFEWLGPLNVPGYSIHQYTASGALGASQWVAPVDGTIDTGAGTSDVTILWDSGPVVANAPYQVDGDFVWDLEVNVVEVKIQSGASNALTYMNPPVQHGNTALIISTVTPPAMSIDLTIERIAGPTVAGGMRGVKFIEMGFVQNGIMNRKHGNFDAFAPPKRRVSSMEDGTWYLDAATGSVHPWYDSLSGQSFFAPQTDVQVNNRAFTTDDTPELLGCDLPELTIGPLTDAVDSLGIELEFLLYFAVRTTQAVNQSDTIYTQRTTATWEFDGDGILTGAGPGTFGTWTAAQTAGNAGNTASTEVTNGSTVPVTAGPTINQLFSGQTWSTVNQ